MGCLKIVGEFLVGWVVPQRGLESLGGCAPLRGEPADRHPVAGDDDGLAVLDLVEDVREVSLFRRSVSATDLLTGLAVTWEAGSGQGPR